MAKIQPIVIITDGRSKVAYYLQGTARQQYTGSGTPWTAAGTTPFALSNNDGAPVWVPKPPEPTRTLSVAAFGDPTVKVQDEAFDPIEDEIGVQMYADTANNAAILLQTLRRVFVTATATTPAQLSVKFGTLTTYWWVYGAVVTETPSYLTTKLSAGVLVRATIKVLRSPFAAGGTGTGTTAIASQTVTNDGTATVAYPGTVNGERADDGQPLNWSLTRVASGGLEYIMAASVHSATKSTTGGTVATTTSSTSFTSWASIGNFDVSAMLTRNGLRARVLTYFSTIPSTITEMRLQVTVRAGGTGFFTTGPVRAVSDDGSLMSIVDFGEIPIRGFYDLLRTQSTATMTPTIYSRSTTGAATSGTIGFSMFLLYWEFCKLIVPASIAEPTQVQLDCFPEQTGYPTLPYLPPRAYTVTASALDQTMRLIGTPPRVRTGASFFTMWMSGGNYTATTTNQATLEATYAPLYSSVKGS